MKKLTATLAILFIIAIPSASAECITTDNLVKLINAENQLNLTPGTFTDSFNNICNNTYTTSDIDFRLNNLNIIDEEEIFELVNEQTQEFINWCDETIGTDKMLYAIYNQTKPQNITIPEINSTDFMTKEDFDSEIDQLKQDIIDNTNMISSGGYTGNVASRNQQDYTGYYAIGIIAAIGLFIAWQQGYLKKKPTNLQTIEPIQPTRNSWANEDQEVSNSQKDAAIRIITKKKIKRLQEDIDDTLEKEKDKKKRDEKVAELEKEVEKLSSRL